MEFDHVLNLLGDFGRYQKLLYSMLCCMLLPTVFIVWGQVFTSADVQHRCYVAELGDTRHVDSSGINRNETRQLPLFIPSERRYDACQLSNCYRYFYPNRTADYPKTSLNDTLASSPASPCSRPKRLPIAYCNDGWTYYHDDDSGYRSSSVTEWDLVCDRAWLREVARSSVIAGGLVGSLLLSPLCDRFGRRPIIFIGLVVNILSGIGTALSPYFQLFVAFQFVTGMTFCSVFSASYIYVQEWVGPSMRTFVGCTISCFASVFILVLTAVAYFVRHWRALQLLISIPQSTLLAYWWFIPESPRWLLSQGRVKEAEVVIMKAARINKADLRPLLPMQGSWRIELDVSKKGREEEPGYTVFDLLRTPKLRRITLNIFFHWSAACLVFYGVTLNTDLLPGNQYINFCISGIVDVPATLIAMMLTERMGRPRSLCLYFLVAGVGCMASSLVPRVSQVLVIISIVLAMIGKMGAAAAFYSSWIYATELYPTILRGTGIGAAVSVARLGGIASPFVFLISNYWRPGPFIVYGIVAILAGIFILWLPETHHRHLPTTVDDVEQKSKLKFKKKRKRKVAFAPVKSYINPPRESKRTGEYPLTPLASSKAAEAMLSSTVDERLLAESRL
ncbi:organic cation transporter protein-like [Ptychodera flava]|uniref:organic cation transporter protein-like n=1 Tax=Ptychodera flava TaxID=63121 RepID=UPI003969CD0E